DATDTTDEFRYRHTDPRRRSSHRLGRFPWRSQFRGQAVGVLTPSPFAVVVLIANSNFVDSAGWLSWGGRFRGNIVTYSQGDMWSLPLVRLETGREAYL